MIQSAIITPYYNLDNASTLASNYEQTVLVIAQSIVNGAFIAASLSVILIYSLLRCTNRSLTKRCSLRLVVFTATSNMFFCIFDIMSEFDIAREGNKSSSPWCTFTMAGYVFFNLASLFFVTCIAINLQLVIVHGYGTVSFEQWYILFSVLVPAVVATVASVAGAFEWDDRMHTCYYIVQDDLMWLWITLYLWWVLSTTYSAVAVVLVVAKLYKQERLMASLKLQCRSHLGLTAESRRFSAVVVDELGLNTSHMSPLKSLSRSVHRNSSVQQPIEHLSTHSSRGTISARSCILPVASIVKRVVVYPIVLILSHIISFVIDFMTQNSKTMPLGLLLVNIAGVTVYRILIPLVFVLDPAVVKEVAQIKLFVWQRYVIEYEQWAQTGDQRNRRPSQRHVSARLEYLQSSARFTGQNGFLMHSAPFQKPRIARLINWIARYTCVPKSDATVAPSTVMARRHTVISPNEWIELDSAIPCDSLSPPTTPELPQTTNIFKFSLENSVWPSSFHSLDKIMSSHPSRVDTSTFVRPLGRRPKTIIVQESFDAVTPEQSLSSHRTSSYLLCEIDDSNYDANLPLSLLAPVPPQPTMHRAPRSRRSILRSDSLKLSLLRMNQQLNLPELVQVDLAEDSDNFARL
ncbi:hypothetical protein BC937DRAFT_90232 [Endogone sp. FLAS-F59071]|nr:hypothetical protein BC937DRAFT_90232 [Endogone sp. FLAS-F59071]|eukprot:RUS22147.1 hypothetical protein BC937DRAFT_90232 [Endogone sp. FLAS-F59071]